MHGIVPDVPLNLKFTAVVYLGKAYHGYTVVASYHIPYR